MKLELKFLILFMTPFILTGCWDRVEIEERGFVIGMAIDLKEENKDEKNPEYEITYQYVIPSGFGGPTQGGGDTESFKNVTETGESLYEIGKETGKEVSRTPFYEHLQIVVISQAVSEHEGTMENIMDFLIRDHEMRRATKLFISKEKSAKEILEVKPKVEKLPSMYIDSISENHYKTAELLKPAAVGDVHEYLLEENNFVLPAIRKEDDAVKLDGAAVFKGITNSFVGYINEDEIAGLNFITSEVRGGAIKTHYKDSLIIYEIERADSKVEPIVKAGGDIEFKITINTEGKIVQSYKSIDFMNQSEIVEIEKALEDSLVSTIKDTIEKTQKEIKVDILGLNRVLEHKKYDTWKVIKKHWDRGEGTFPTAKINVKPNIIIRTTGTSSKTTN